MTLFAAALLLTAAGASAQTVLTKVDVEGRVSSNDRPETTAPQQDETAPAIEAPKPKFRRLIGADRAAAINTQEAERRLAQAQLKRQEGMEPLPGDLVPGTPGQVNYRYWRRQETLRLAVELAQRRLNQTQQIKLARR